MRKLFGVIVLVAILLGLDRGGAWLAGRAVAAQVQQSAHLQTAPTVTIGGFPFLTQVVQGRYTHVDVDTAGPVRIGDLGLDRLKGTVTGAQAPLSKIIDGSLSAIPVDQADASAHIGYAELDRLVNSRLSADGLQLHFSSGGSGQVALRAVIDTPPGAVQLKARAHVSVQGGRLRVKVSDQDLQQSPPLLRTILAAALDRTFPLPKLAMGFTVTSAHPDASGLALAVGARHTTLALP